MRLGGDALLALVRGGRDPDLPARGEARERREFLTVGGRRRRVEFHVADNLRGARAQRRQALGVARRLREAEIDARRAARG